MTNRQIESLQQTLVVMKEGLASISNQQGSETQQSLQKSQVSLDTNIARLKAEQWQRFLARFGLAGKRGENADSALVLLIGLSLLGAAGSLQYSRSLLNLLTADDSYTGIGCSGSAYLIAFP